MNILLFNNSANFINKIQTLLINDEIALIDNANKINQALDSNKYELLIINVKYDSTDVIERAVYNNIPVMCFINKELYDSLPKKVMDYRVIYIYEKESKKLILEKVKLLANTIKIAKVNSDLSMIENYHLYTINKAKIALMTKLGYSENDAHKFIEKTAMNERVTKYDIALSIIEEYK